MGRDVTNTHPPGAESTDFQISRLQVPLFIQLTDFNSSGFQGQTLWEFRFPVWAPLCFPSPRPQLLPYCGQLLSTFSTLPNLSDVASLLHVVVEFVLPIFILWFIDLDVSDI